MNEHQPTTSCIVHLADSANFKGVTPNKRCNGLTGSCFESPNDTIHLTVSGHVEVSPKFKYINMSKYKNRERENAPKRKCFNNYSFNGIYRKIPREFILSDWENNFFKEIPQKLILSYFDDNKISWWGGKKPTGHILSSQIACLNYLFIIRTDKDAVLNLAQTINSDCIKSK
jgi:hypothetical protein